MAQKKSPEEFRKEFLEASNGEYELLSEYITNKIKITIKHVKCNTTYETTPSSFLNGRRCVVCSNNSKRKTTEKFKEEVNELTNGEFSVAGEYIDNKTKIEIKHNKCNRVFNTKPNTFLTGKFKCPLCYEEDRGKTQEEFEKEVTVLVGNEYTFLEPYINNYTPILVRHNKEGCSHVYKVKPTHFLHENKRCAACNNLSVFAKQIKGILDEHGIKYEIEKKFEDLKNDKGIYYRFDFCIYIEHGTFFLLEYDGKQHFEAKYGNRELEKTKERDRIKNEYCIRNDYKLIRIRYEQDGKGYKEVLMDILKDHKFVA